MFDVKKVREDFPILKRRVNGKKLVYLDNAATSQKPKQVIKAVSDFYKNHNANIHRGIHTLGDEATRIYDEAREKVAAFIGADKDELIFVRNATEGINLVAFSWATSQIKRGEEVLVTEMEHHSNIVPWLRLVKLKGVRVKFVRVNNEGLLDMRDFERKLSKKTRLVAVVHCSNMTGTINPVEKIVRLSKKVNARVLVDGAQSVQHVGVNVKKIGCDFMAFSGHKMMGPMGIGGLYVRKERQDEMGPFMTGGGMISEVYKDRVLWIEGVEKFEAGTPNVAGAVGLAEAVDYHKKLKMENIRDHEKELTEYLLKQLKETKGVRVFGTDDMRQRGGVVSFVLSGIHAHDVAQVLDREMGVAVRSGHHCTMPLHNAFKVVATTRASVYVYNTKGEIDQLVEGLMRVKKLFGV